MSTESSLGVRVVGEAESGAAGLALFFRCRPDVVLLDICLPDANGFTILDQIRTAAPRCAVVMLGKSFEGVIEAACLIFGATGFFCKLGETISIEGIVRDLQEGLSAPAAGAGITHRRTSPLDFVMLGRS